MTCTGENSLECGEDISAQCVVNRRRIFGKARTKLNFFGLRVAAAIPVSSPRVGGLSIGEEKANINDIVWGLWGQWEPVASAVG
jgi:hypothetical protein